VLLGVGDLPTPPRGALLYVGIGLRIGIPLAIACGRYLANQLHDVGRFNALALGGATLAQVSCPSGS